MNIVTTRIYCISSPLSIKRFNHVKNIRDIKDMIDQASLYIIANRDEVPHIELVEESPISGVLTDFDDSQYVMMNFKLCKNNYCLHAAYLLPDNVDRGLFVQSISSITIEELLYSTRQNYGRFVWIGDIVPLITYDVFYVGHCINEPLTKRFKAHHTLQEMLIEEKVLSSHRNKADELILFPLYIDSQVMSLITPRTIEKEAEKAFLNDYDFGNREINLDAEKALVHNLNPKYNKVRFKKYPNSDDGLDNTNANVYTYSIGEYVLFKYDNGIIYGHPDDNYTSKIVGDDDGFTKIYDPGESITKRYMSRIFPYSDIE